MKSTFTLTLVFVILTGLSTWKYFGNVTEYMDLESSPALFDGFLPDTVASIQVVRPKQDGSLDAQGNVAMEGLVFMKQEGKWIIADQRSPFFGVPVMSSQIVSDILDRVGRIKITDSNVVNSRADEMDLAEKEVDEKAGMRIVCQDSSQQILADLYVGRSAGKKVEGTNEAVEGTFVRKAKAKQILLFEEAFPLDLESKTWIDKTRRDVSNDQVTEIEIEGKADGKTIAVHFKRDGNKGWRAVQTPADVGPLKEFSVTEIIRAACRVDAIDIIARLNPAQLEQYGLAPKSRLHVIIKTKDDKTLDLFVGKRVEGKQDYYAHIGGPLLFSLAEWDVSRYEKEAKEFFDPKPVETQKPGDGKSGDGKSGDGKSGDGKPGEETPDEVKKGDGQGGGENTPSKAAETPKKGDGKKDPAEEHGETVPGDLPGKADPMNKEDAPSAPANVDPGKNTPTPGTPAVKGSEPASQPAKKD